MLSRSASNVDVQHSRYAFSAENNTAVSNIAPDGAATVWNEGRYGGSHSPGHDSIVAYTSEPESGLVKTRVIEFEGLSEAGPRIDLSKVPRGSKARNMQPKVRIARALLVLVQRACLTLSPLLSLSRILCARQTSYLYGQHLLTAIQLFLLPKP